ncbi:hypothetical protein SISNIDRAFT_529667 [Sistotremastrum niveocremeum HHB9708]|uniref:F-box domain-containing protein n=1 Tax=Sistotremastrum niveocremeum HHB9708 TaxID=1314777 RepID=A0A164YVN8_9AGAM|nr:hypothetical protein SISNIDRAFT_529667 [Sistotremastrum niveocremeum HHB9708]
MDLLPDELILELGYYTGLREWITLSHTNTRLRAIVSSFNHPFRKRLLSLAFQPSSSLPVSLKDRLIFVSMVETVWRIVIPEDCRILWTEWPNSQPPPGIFWPQKLRFHANGYCPRYVERVDACFCKSAEVQDSWITIHEAIRDEIIANERSIYLERPEEIVIDDVDASIYKPLDRLRDSETQKRETVKFIRSIPLNDWKEVSPFENDYPWLQYEVPTLLLSRRFREDNDAVVHLTGEYRLILKGPAAGQIHAWQADEDYAGFEASSILDWEFDSDELERKNPKT